MQEVFLQLIGKHLPHLDEVSVQYLMTILGDAAESGEYDDVIDESIVPFLEDAGVSPETIADLCASLKAVVLPSSTSTTKPSLVKQTTMVAPPAATTSFSTTSSTATAPPLSKSKARKAAKKQTAQDSCNDNEDSREEGEDEDEEEEDGVFGSQNSRFHQDHVGDSKIIYIRGLFLAYKEGHELLENATLKLAPGRKYGLIGANGIGKTTLLRSIALGKLKDFPKHIRISYVEQEVVGNDQSALQWVINADTELAKLRNEEKRLLNSANDPVAVARLAEVYEQLSLMEGNEVERATELLKSMKFTQAMMNMPTSELSGGWRMRVALARAIFIYADLVLLDEPTNHLDLVSIIWLRNFLKNCDNTLLVISHDREFLNEVATDIIRFHDQKLTYYSGNYDAYEKERHEKLQKQKRLFDWQTRQEEHIKNTISTSLQHAKATGNDKVLGMVASRKKKLERFGVEKRDDGTRWRVATRRKDGSFDWLRQKVEAPKEEKPIVFSFNDPPVLLHAGPSLQLQDVCYAYDASLTGNVIEAITLDIDVKKARIGIVGRNGGGKSTLLSLLAGKLTPTRGTVFVHHNIRIAFYSQHHVDQLDHSISPVAYLQKKFAGLDVQEARKGLGSFGLSGSVALQSIASLSGGQKCRVVLTELALSYPHVLLLDEPSNHLDLDSIEGLIRGLNEFKGAVVIASHDQHLVQSVAKDVYVLANKTITLCDFSNYVKGLKKDAS